MMKLDQEGIEKILEAIIFCMDYALSVVTDDDEYSEKIDLQNELREMLSEFQQSGE
jgi:hypothetical protein